MAGISSKAAGGLENKFGITSKEKQSYEFLDGTGLEMYDFGARFQDPQIGRWFNVDPLSANYYWLSPYNYCNNNPIKYLDPNGMEFKDTLGGRHDVATLQTVTVTSRPKANNALANLAFGWANEAAKPAARLWVDRQETYQSARFNGWSQADMSAAWSKAGITDDDLTRFERYYQAEVDYRNMSLVAVGVIGAPVVAVAAHEIFAGTMMARLGSAGADLTVQYAVNIGKGYGFVGQNFANINIASVGANFAMPGSALGSSVVGNGLNFSVGGYAGISATANSSTIGGQILLGYGGNRLGSGLSNLAGKYMNAGGLLNNYAGNVHGNLVSGVGQFISENR